MMYKWTAPKKNNDRMWKRIERGDWWWDRRRARRAQGAFRSWTEFHPVNQKKGTHHSTGGYRSEAQVELGA